MWDSCMTFGATSYPGPCWKHRICPTLWIFLAISHVFAHPIWAPVRAAWRAWRIMIIIIFFIIIFIFIFHVWGCTP